MSATSTSASGGGGLPDTGQPDARLVTEDLNTLRTFLICQCHGDPECAVHSALARLAEIALAAASPSADTVQAPDVAALLRFAAAGRREYATNAPGDQAAALESAAETFDQAARIASGDVNSLRFAVPSWRWDEADALLGTDTPEGKR